MESLPVEIVEQILLQCSTPSFIQLARASKTLSNIARQSHKALTHHIHQVPGPKDTIEDKLGADEKLLLLLRQRAASNLYGCHLTADLTQCLPIGARLNVAASNIRATDFSLVFHDHTDLRIYAHSGSEVVLRERIQRPPGTRIVKVVRTANLISVLEARPIKDDPKYIPDPDDHRETVRANRLIPISQILLQAQSEVDEEVAESETPLDDTVPTPPVKTSTCKYKLCFFHAVSLKQLGTFDIYGAEGLVPRDLTVYDVYNCAILWEDVLAEKPVARSIITSLTASEENPRYTCKTLWPRPQRTESSVAAEPDSSVGSHESKSNIVDIEPTRIAYFRDGRRLKIYEAGGLVPSEVIDATNNETLDFNATNKIIFDGFCCQVETPFYGTHKQVKTDENYGWEMEQCYFTRLCLGVASFDDEDYGMVQTLCILRSQTGSYSDCCDHEIKLDNMAQIGAQSTTVVARLWGWGGASSSNFTGSETVAISPGGTRIAISAWNKIHVYALNPEVLCDEYVVEDDERSMKRRKKMMKRGKQYREWERPVSDYYARRKDPNFCDWNMVEIRPTVIDLEGAVARHMCWTPTKEPITGLSVQGDEPQIEVNTSSSDDTEEDATGEEQEVSDAPTLSDVAETSPTNTLVTHHVNTVPEQMADSQAYVSDNVSDTAATGGFAVEEEEDECTPPASPSPASTASTSPSLVGGVSSNTSNLAMSIKPTAISESPTLATKTSPRQGKNADLPTGTNLLENARPLSSLSSEEHSVSEESAATTSSTLTTKTQDVSEEPLSQGTAVAPSVKQSSTASVPGINPVPEQAEVPDANKSKAESKSTDNFEAAVYDPTTGTQGTETAAEAQSCRVRITEDELTVLTDKGIQIWNFGARASRARRTTVLPLQEGPHRNKPAWKGKSKAAP